MRGLGDGARTLLPVSVIHRVTAVVALSGLASCSGPVRSRGLRSVITQVAMQMAASIALGQDGKTRTPRVRRSFGIW